MKDQKYHTVGTIPKLNIKIVERSDNPNIHTYNDSWVVIALTYTHTTTVE